MKSHRMKVTLEKIGNNLVFKIPKHVEQALGLHQGQDVLITVDKGEMRISPA